MAIRAWSRQQQAIFDWFRTPRLNPITDSNYNLVVRARAGTGKTTTILEAVQHAPETAILVAAFNKRIQAELAAKLSNPNAEALTLHSIGFRAVKRYWERIGIDSRGARAAKLAEDACGEQAPDAIKRLVAKLGTKAREMAPLSQHGSDLVDIAIQFDCAPDDAWKTDGYDLDYVCERAAETLELAAKNKPTATGIDFADMLFLPIRNQWLRPVYDLVVVDEAQDMTTTQLLLATGVSRGRIAVVGDDRQAIYGFRGADSGSLDRLKAELHADELGLTTTYRCAKIIVREAQRLVPDFTAGSHNPEGVIRSIVIDQVWDQVNPGDFILSRRNAPLVALALGLVRRGRRAKIEGRDLGAGLKAIVNKLATGPAKNSIPAWLEKLGTWRERETLRAEKAGLEHKVEETLDKYETLLALVDGVSGIAELLTRIDGLFADDAANVSSQIVCSSVHRAKGLEADRVFILRDTLNPPVACQGCRRRQKGCKCTTFVPDPLQQREEQNIEYVAITRAKNELVWVSGEPSRR